ncbi:MAG: hypothetical protein WDN76_11100 [Alphaproteobacteria bacterium]
MFKLLSTLVLVGAVGAAAYFTRPGEVAMREAANAVLSDPKNVSEGIEGLGATLNGDRVYQDLYVGAKYAVKLDDKVLVDCWGAFTKVNCTRNKTESNTPG